MFNRFFIFCILFGLLQASCQSRVETFSGTVCVELEHHGAPLFGATVYRNFGNDFPGYHKEMDMHYDTIAETGLRNSVCFDKLGVGGHWFAAEGFDEFIQDSVRGSLYIELGTSIARVDTVVRVSEQH